MFINPDYRQRFLSWLSNEFRPSALGTSLLSGLLIYTLEIIFVVSFAALIFSGPLAGHLPQALGYVLVGNAAMAILVTLISSYPGSIAVEQDTPGAVLALVTLSVVAAIPAGADLQQFATVVMMIVISTSLTGIFFLFLGIFKLGGLVRFLPYPIMGGFLAGTGWLLTVGGIGVMTGNVPFGPGWLETGVLVHWLPGGILGLLIYFAVRKFNRTFTLPLILIIAGIGFYVVAWMMNLSFAELQAGDWLLGSFPAGSLYKFPLNSEILYQVNWPVLIQELPAMAPATIVSVIALLLNSSGLELIIKKDIDLNRELAAAGVGNLAAGFFGGLIGYQAISLSALNHKVNGGKRLAGVFAGLLMGTTIFFGAIALVYIPKLILGAILIYLGIALLFEWIYEAWFKFPRIDFVIILSILVVIVSYGFLQGILAGLVMAIIMFVVSYSQVSVIKFALSGREYQSRVTRNLQQQRVLDEFGERFYILKLQGFIFFGTANNIFDRIRQQIQAKPAGAVHFVLLDFTQVSGLDSTGLLSFSRMLQWCQEKQIVLILVGLHGRAHEQFNKGGFSDESSNLRLIADLDHGIEWCEEQMIASITPDAGTESNFEDLMKSVFPEDIQVKRVLSKMQRREIPAGETFIHEGDKADEILFVESGQITAYIEKPGAAPIRLETMSGGRIVGEVAFFLGGQRSASVIADQPSVIYSISHQALNSLEEEDIATAYIFQNFIIRFLGQRILHLMRVVSALQKEV